MKLQGVIRLIAVCPLLLSLGMPIAYGQPVADKPGLQENPYQEFSLGAIKPAGWLEEMLVRQKEGLSGNLDRLYPLVMGPTNGWLGGDGDQWERGPYWIDGLLPLAYILDDAELIAKVKPWIEWTLASQKENGYFGPDTDYENTIVGIQRNNCGDWWPKMVMLKVMQQYYSATGDKRVIDFMTKYFQYQLKTLPVYPLDHWTFWARYRGGDNLMSVYWLYNITGDDFLLDLGEIIYSQTFPFTQIFTSHNWWHTGSMHCVNLAHGMKTPLIYYQRHPEQKYVDAAKQGLKDINTFISGPHGVIIGDEALHGNNPTQGSELCTAVEMMFSLENMLQIAGDPDYASQIERIAFNALPTQISDNFMTRQYFQQINQVEISMCDRNFDTNHHVLANQAGTSYAAGEVISQTLSSSSDGIIPCTSPVEWPIGYRDGVGVFNTTTQPLWMTDHIWTASQPQATMTYEVSEDNPAPVKIEVNNFVQYNYSSGCVKGSWTGDYFEFDVPVRNFKAGTEVTLTLPTYGRGAPLFWDVYYLDGEEWKCDRTSHTSPDGQFTMTSTLMIEHGNRDGNFEGIKYEVKMLFENAIQSGHLKIRFQVAHGGYITNPAGAYSTACRELTAEERKTFDIGATLFAFVNKSGNVNSVKIEW